MRLTLWTFFDCVRGQQSCGMHSLAFPKVAWGYVLLELHENGVVESCISPPRNFGTIGKLSWIHKSTVFSKLITLTAYHVVVYPLLHAGTSRTGVGCWLMVDISGYPTACESCPEVNRGSNHNYVNSSVELLQRCSTQKCKAITWSAMAEPHDIIEANDDAWSDEVCMDMTFVILHWLVKGCCFRGQHQFVLIHIL